MKKTDEKTESEKIEKLLEKTLDEHLERMMQIMNKRDKRGSILPDAKYSPTKSYSPEPGPRRLSPRVAKKGKPPLVPF